VIEYAAAGGESPLYMYSRDGNPTVRAAEEALAELEGAESCVLFASGMGAMTTALFGLVSGGEEVISASALYGGTYRLLRDILSRFGVRHHQVEPEHLAAGVAERGRRSLSIALAATSRASAPAGKRKRKSWASRDDSVTGPPARPGKSTSAALRAATSGRGGARCTGERTGSGPTTTGIRAWSSRRCSRRGSPQSESSITCTVTATSLERR